MATHTALTVRKILERTPLQKLPGALSKPGVQRVISAAIPSWKGIIGVSGGEFHRHTIDLHSIDVTRRIARDARVEAVIPRWALFWSGIMHDIGKINGIQGHEALGSTMAVEEMKAMALPGEDIAAITDLVAFLIREHSEMGRACLRSRKSPVLPITELARKTKTPGRLLALMLLSRADTLSVLGGDGTAAAIDRLYGDVLELLEYGIKSADGVGPTRYEREPEGSKQKDAALIKLLNDGTKGIAHERIDTDGRENSDFLLKVAVRGDSNRLWQIALGLSEKGVNIVRANIFEVQDGIWILNIYCTDSSQKKEELAITFQQQEPRPEVIENTVDATKAKRKDHNLAIDNELAEGQTAIVLATYDRLYLFYRIARVLSNYGTIHQTFASTYNDQVVDVFYVTGKDGKKITDPSVLGQIQEDLSAII